MSFTKVNDAGLTDLYGMSDLQHLDLMYSKATAAGIMQLQKMLPGVQIDL